MIFNDLFPDNREQGETRLRQCQLVMLRMLKILDYLCSKHQINYFLTNGTLLGAVRHNGFIPWDDDMDIGMTRPNYEKFLRYAVYELPNDIFFQNVETDPYYPPYYRVEAKLRDRYSSYTRSEEKKQKYKWHNGIQVDICVYNKAYLPHNFCIYLLNKSIKVLGKSNSDKKRARALKLIAKYSPIPLVYSTSGICSLKTLKRETHFFKGIEISTLIKTRFEDMDASIPVGWESYLKRRYGNYMQLPPVEKQKGHHSADLPDPFTPSEHSESLYWKDRVHEHKVSSIQ
jgi:lipopolysaccharide cholinephosphotransferase